MSDPKAPNPTFGALILAGGRSSRMGTDKASLSYRGVTLLEHMRDLAGQSGAALALVSGGPHGDVPDGVPLAGPVAGLCALADHVPAGQSPERWLVIPVDMPCLQPLLLQRLAMAGSKAISYARRPLPLALTLDRSTRGVLARMRDKLIAGESVAIQRVLELLEADTLAPNEDEEAQLVNANTPAEWKQLESMRGEQ